MVPPPHKHTHVSLSFRDGSILYYNDLRKFGWLHAIKTSQEDSLVGHLGVDPLGEVDTEKIVDLLKKKGKTPVKTVLLDQTIIAGIGNIYADESLFCAKIHPLRLVSSISDVEWQRLLACIPKVLGTSLEKGGTSSSDYVQVDGSKGTYLEVATVYGREDMPCRVCNTLVKRIKIGQRSSHYCPNCQH